MYCIQFDTPGKDDVFYKSCHCHLPIRELHFLHKELLCILKVLFQDFGKNYLVKLKMYAINISLYMFGWCSAGGLYFMQDNV